MSRVGRDAGRATGAARLAVLLSGGGRTLINLVERIERGELPATIGMVIASRECKGIELAAARGFRTRVIGGVIPRVTLGSMLDDVGADLVVLAGYLKLIEIPSGYEGRVVNIHPALLPAFGGPGMHGERVHKAVIDAGCKISGCTVHLCDERFDTGPILAQSSCEVRDDDTPESLAARVFALECDLYPRTLARMIRGRVTVQGRKARIEGT